MQFHFEIRAARLDLDFRERRFRARSFEIFLERSSGENFGLELLFVVAVHVQLDLDLEIRVGSTDRDEKTFDDDVLSDVASVGQELEVERPERNVT